MVNGDFAKSGCRECSELAGVPQNGVCALCAKHKDGSFTQYQHAERVQMPTTLGYDFLLYLWTKCEYSPRGYEYWNWEKLSYKDPCRSIDGVIDCCMICNINWFSTGNGTRCERVPADYAKFTPFGSDNAILCAVGHELVYCNEYEGCLAKSEQRMANAFGWRACRSCIFSDTKRSIDTGCTEWARSS
jgi:hypothetical protein